MVDNSNNNIQLADRARKEVYVQAVRIIKALLRNGRPDEAVSFLRALSQGGIATWEIDIEGVRGKRLFKKSVAVVRSLMGDSTLDAVLNQDEVEHLEHIAKSGRV